MKVIDEQYLEKIRTETCVVCSRETADPDHIQARQWRDSNRNDYFALPLCRQHHEERHQIGNIKFQESHIRCIG